MRNPHGYAVITDPVAGVLERDTFLCNHCNSIHRVRPREKPEDIGGLCKVCMQLICGPCVNVGTCTPFEKQVDQMEAKDRFLRSAGLI